MSATVSVSRPASSNRRSHVRQKVHVPAYATFSAASPSAMLNLHEVLDISETGVALQCSSPVQINQTVELRLDLAEAAEPISTTARVVWSDSTGHVGFHIPTLTDPVVRRLREWLFLNALAAAANADYSAAPKVSENPIKQNYTDILSAASAIQTEAESLGSDLEAVLSLVASRAQSLLRASGAAIAIAGKDGGSMVCQASAGPIAPPVGATLQVGSGFSGECVRTGAVLRCDDSETDQRVDLQSCRALGIRSMLAAPVRIGEKVIGLLEVFSAQPRAFNENDSAVLQRFAETILAAVNRAARVHTPTAPPTTPKPFVPPPGSVLFAHPPESNAEKNLSNDSDQDKVGGIRLPRVHLYLLIAAAATIALALGFILAPWIQARLQARERTEENTVLASSKPPADASNSPAIPTAESASLAQLHELAERGDATAENALGLLYAQGDDKQAVKPDEREAARWFTRAAEHGNVLAQSKLGSLYFSGRGVSKDNAQAYFWTVLARASGDAGSKALAPFIAVRLPVPQRAAIEQQADQWLQQHESPAKTTPAR
jgi:putative methionine-R-sulfoxide reductase with GAF domain